MKSRYYIIPIFVPHLGCPHDCVFCNQTRITGLSTDMTSEKVEETIEEYFKTFPEGEKTVEVAFFGGSFTGIDRDIQEELLSVPYRYKNVGKIQGIRLSTRPDYIDVDILELLKKYTVDTIELGVQSLSQDVLDSSGRGHNVEIVYKSSKLIKEYGFNLGLQMMLGLVGDNREKSIMTAKELIKLAPYCVRIYPTLIIKDTYLETLYNNGKYNPLSLEEAIELTTDILSLFDYNNIDVIRVGLQPTENIQLGKDVVAGPFHPSFRQLVEANIVKNIIDSKLMEENIANIDNLIISSNCSNISNISGQKGVNKKFLIEKYNIKNIKLHSENINKDTIILEIGDNKYYISINEYRKSYLERINLI